MDSLGTDKKKERGREFQLTPVSLILRGFHVIVLQEPVLVFLIRAIHVPRDGRPLVLFRSSHSTKELTLGDVIRETKKETFLTELILTW
jgi:hypothetical protein